MIIESKDNKLIKYAKKLLDKKYSIRENKILVESPKLIRELIGFGEVYEILIEENSKFSKDFEGINNVYYISSNIAKLLSQTETSTGVFAIVSIPKTCEYAGGKAIVLDNIQDPTNYGAICRSAAAFGFNTIFDINSTFAYSPKVTRCSMGNNFKLNIIKTSYEYLEKLKENKCIELICLDMDGKDVKNSRPESNNFAIIIGNEGNGVSDNLRKLSDKIVAIPMENNVESLNAAISASIIMYTLS